VNGLTAEVHSLGGGNWRGTTNSCSTIDPNNHHDFIRKARTMLAGPLANVLLDDGRGRATDHFPEILGAAFTVAHAAALSQQDLAILWQSTTTEAGALSSTGPRKSAPSPACWRGAKSSTFQTVRSRASWAAS
jgi:hypothetical protein